MNYFLSKSFRQCPLFFLLSFSWSILFVEPPYWWHELGRHFLKDRLVIENLLKMTVSISSSDMLLLRIHVP